MRSSKTFPGPGHFVWLKVRAYPDAYVQPLDAETVEQAHRARVWVGGAIAAYLQRSGGRWEFSLLGQPEHIESGGSAATATAAAAAAVRNWLQPSEENQA